MSEDSDKDDESSESSDSESKAKASDFNVESIIGDLLNNSDVKSVLEQVNEEEILQIHMDRYRCDAVNTEEPQKSFSQRVKERFRGEMTEEDARRLNAIKPEVLAKRKLAIEKLTEYKKVKIDKYLKEFYVKKYPSSKEENPTFNMLTLEEKNDFKRQYQKKMDRNDKDAAYHLALGDKDYRKAAIKKNSDNSISDPKSLERATRGYDAIIKNPSKLNQWRITTAVMRNPKTIAAIIVPMAASAVFMPLQVVGFLLTFLALEKAATAIGVTLYAAGAASSVKDFVVLRQAVYEKIDQILKKDVSEERLIKGEKTIDKALIQEQERKIEKLQSLLKKLGEKSDRIWRREAKRQILFGQNNPGEMVRPEELKSSLQLLEPLTASERDHNIESQNLGQLNLRMNNISEYLKDNQTKETKELLAVFEDVGKSLSSIAVRKSTSSRGAGNDGAREVERLALLGSTGSAATKTPRPE